MTYWYREFPVSGIFHFFGGIGTGIGKKLVPEKSLGTGIGKIWYRKKVLEPVSEKFSTGKKSRNRYRKNLVPEKVLEIQSNIFGTEKNLVPISQFCCPCLSQ